MSVIESTIVQAEAKTHPATSDQLAHLRNLLFKVLRPDVQAPFHHVYAARTPEEWVQRNALLAEELAEKWDWDGQLPGRSAKEVYCPLCRTGIPNMGSDEDRKLRLLQHFNAEVDASCQVLRELEIVIGSRGLEKFDQRDLAAAHAEYSAKLPKPRGRQRGSARR
ncbi:hypothetical protein [Ramlibacter sp.]|uniref:hypothetical protein n=1 Tax=Ramlibacter sp. TaxID=1917967 RepID=UPI002FC88443